MKQRPRVLITGASKGLGRALAFRFGRQGAQLALVARNAGALDATVQELRGSGIDAIGITADLAKAKDAKRIAALAFEHLGAIDILIHNASTLGPTPLPRLDEIDDEDFEQVFQVGVLGPQRLTRSIIGNMALRGDGLVISISSDAAVEAYPRWGAYSAAKAAQDHLMRIWASECESEGLRFLSIDPGEMDTEMHAAALPDADPHTLARPTLVADRIAAIVEDSAPTSGSRVRAQELAL